MPRRHRHRTQRERVASLMFRDPDKVKGTNYLLLILLAIVVLILGGLAIADLESPATDHLGRKVAAPAPTP
ncbi:MAG TPA: hypothetical protein VKU00_30600 [Chthonomonadaceae bacterium]|nr:hypothetical protein [Chthonomonadaceae bacterium]